MTRIVHPLRTVEEELSAVDQRSLDDRVHQTQALFNARAGLPEILLNRESLVFYLKQGKTPREIVDDLFGIKRSPFVADAHLGARR